MNHQYVTKLANNLAFQGKTIWSKEPKFDAILTHRSKSAPGKIDWVAISILEW